MTNPLSPEYLANFYGSETFVRWSPLTESILSEGAHHVANAAGAFWLFDLIDSHLTTHGLDHLTEFCVARLKVFDGSFTVTLDDGNGQIWASQQASYTDFPLPEFKTFAVWNGNGWTHMLPSEY